MTIPNSPLNTNEKSQDFVESDEIHMLSGVCACRIIFVLYVMVISAAATTLYLFPNVTVIYGFMALMLLLMISLYPLVKFVIKIEDNDLIWDSDGLHWLKKADVPALEYGNYRNSLDQSFKIKPTNSNYHLSYAFI